METSYDRIRNNILTMPEYRSQYGAPQMNETMQSRMGTILSDTRTNAINQNKALMQLDEWNNRQKMYDPNFWAQIFNGSSATSVPVSSSYDARLNSLISDPNSIANSGAYKFRLDQGNQAIQRSAAAKGMLGSGNTLAELLKYGQGEASQEYGNEVGRLTALRGQDMQLQAQREAANLSARNAFAQAMMNQMFTQSNTANKNLNAPPGMTFY